MTLEILLRTENDRLVQKYFARLDLKEADPSTLSVASVVPNWGKYRHQINQRYTPRALADQYIESIKTLHGYFQDTVRHKWTSEDLLQKLLLARFSYASPAAYQLKKPVFVKEKPGDQEFTVVANYNNNYGIYVSLPEDFTLGDIKRYGIHELGHLMHHLDAPENYRASDATIKETMALLIEVEQGMNLIYKKDTPHWRAQQLLIKANRKKLRGKDFAEKWNTLTKFKKQKDLEDYINGKLIIFPEEP